MAERQNGEAWTTAVATILLLMAVPSAVFLALALAGGLKAWLAVVGWAVCGVGAGVIGLALGHDLAAMTGLMRALRTEPDTLPEEAGLLMPGMRALGQEAVRLIHAERLVRARSQATAIEDRALVERLPDPLFKLDGMGRVMWRNESASTAFAGETAALLRHPDVREAEAEAQSRGQPVRREVGMAAPVARDLEVTIIPAGELLYMLVNDRTRERALEKMRADFVANSSHELRTPLASLIGFIETLRGPAADDREAQQNFLGIMAEQAARMQRVIGDLLSLSRIEISEHSPPKELLLLPPVLSRIVAAMEPMVKAQDTKLLVDVPDDLPRLPADADQLAQLFTNLLDNALKYGQRGGEIRLSASAAPDTRFPAGGVVVTVADDGAGIAREHIPRLTERFYRVDKGCSRAVGGTGLGLAIVKHVVNRHRGRLVIESELGKGTAFSVWLPTPDARTG